MAQSFVRHGRADDAASAVPGIVRTMEQALALAEATMDPGRRGPSINELQLVARTIWLWA